jgi:hypothetical protein
MPRQSQGMTRVGTNPGLEMLGKWKYREGEGKWVIIGSQLNPVSITLGPQAHAPEIEAPVHFSFHWV